MKKISVYLNSKATSCFKKKNTKNWEEDIWLASLFTIILELLSDAVSQDQNIREVNTKNIFDSYDDLYRKSVN